MRERHRSSRLDTGPTPMPKKAVLQDPVLGALTCDALTCDVQVYQRRDGHRFSVDDVATAYVAHACVPRPATVLDLGCGLGSVLLHLAWKMPEARLWGVEAQSVSFALLERNVALNQLESRVRVAHGDLREVARVAALAPAGGFALITGTPPYFPVHTALNAADEQRSYARIEMRGGVEAYIEAAARVLAAAGVLVLCGDARAAGRVHSAASGVGLRVTSTTAIVAREDKPVLFSVWTLRAVAEVGALQPMRERRLVIRDRFGNYAEGAHRLRAFSGFPPRDRDPARV